MKKLKLLKKDQKTNFYQIYTLAYNNAVELLSEAEILYGAGKHARAYFLAFTALEEISKSQLAADVYTGLTGVEEFWNYYKSHEEKTKRMTWATLDANEFPNNIFNEMGEVVNVNKPKIKKRMNSLYVYINKESKVINPKNTISVEDAKDMIHTVNVAIHQTFLMTEYYGHQIGTKGFMK